MGAAEHRQSGDTRCPWGPWQAGDRQGMGRDVSPGRGTGGGGTWRGCGRAGAAAWRGHGHAHAVPVPVPVPVPREPVAAGSPVPRRVRSRALCPLPPSPPPPSPPPSPPWPPLPSGPPAVPMATGCRCWILPATPSVMLAPGPLPRTRPTEPPRSCPAPPSTPHPQVSGVPGAGAERRRPPPPSVSGFTPRVLSHGWRSPQPRGAESRVGAHPGLVLGGRGH